MRPVHCFSVDVEEHFQVSAFESHVSRADWDGHPSRVEGNTMRIVEALARHDATGTFFVLGWVAERHPGLVKTIAAAGHEIASHGWDHRRVTDLSPDQFRDQVRRSKVILEQLSGSSVLGYRAPSYSIVAGREWALDILVEEGYGYDSSLFPVRRRGYGYAAGARDPHWLERPAGRLREVPPATLRRAGVNLPAAGGAYFRLLPMGYGLIASALRDAGRRGVPGTFYIHPWEVDPDQPRIAVPRLTQVRHYGGLAGTMGRLERLLAEFSFTSIARTLEGADVVRPGTVPAS